MSTTRTEEGRPLRHPHQTRRWSKVAYGFLAGSLLLAACGSDTSDSGGSAGGSGGGSAEAGKKIVGRTCTACHGADLKGGVGLPLKGSEFVKNTPSADLVKFLERGRPVDDPANKTGTAMPPKGGDSSLTTEDLENVVAYLKSINE